MPPGSLSAAWAQTRHTACTVELNAQEPNRDNGSEHGQSANGPAGDIETAIAVRSIDHRVVPLLHESLPPACLHLVKSRTPGFRFKHKLRTAIRRGGRGRIVRRVAGAFHNVKPAGRAVDQGKDNQ